MRQSQGRRPSGWASSRLHVFSLLPNCTRHCRSAAGRTIVKCIKASLRVHLVRILVTWWLMTDAAGNQSLKARQTLILSLRSWSPFTTGASALDCHRQAHINTFRTLRLAILSYRRVAITNGIHVRSLKRCTCLQARQSARGDLSAIERWRFFETFEVFPCFRIVKGDCLFEPHSCSVNVPLRSSTIEVKHPQIVHGLCIAEICRLFK